MFYSHEVLTSRKYGVATIWLVATLGLNRSTLRKVNRKDILAVKIPKACNTVTNIEVPMALRLQAHLLVGISRVYLQQFEYLYHDVSHAHMRMRRLELVNMDQINDKPSKETHAEQLILMDDPMMHPDLLGLDLTSLGDLALFDIAQPHDPEPGVGSFVIGSTPRRGSFMLGSGTSPSSFGGASGHIPVGFSGGSVPLVRNDDPHDQFEENPLFGFDAEGNLRENTPEPVPLLAEEESPAVAARSRSRARGVGGNLDSDDIEAQVRREHEEGHHDAMEIDRPIDEDAVLPDLMDLDEQLLAPNAEDGVVEREVTPAPVVRRSRKKHVIVDEGGTIISIDSIRAWYAGHNQAAGEAFWAGGVGNFLAKDDLGYRHFELAVLDQTIMGENDILKSKFSLRAALNKFRAPAVAAIDGGVQVTGRTSREGTQDGGQQEVGRSEGIRRAGELPEPPGSDVELGRDAPLHRDEVVSIHSGDHIFSPAGAKSSSSAAGLLFPGFGARRSSSPLQPGAGRIGSRISVAGSVLGVVEEVDESNLLVTDDGPDHIDHYGHYGQYGQYGHYEIEPVHEEVGDEKHVSGFYDHIRKTLAEEQARRKAELEEPVDHVIFHEIVRFDESSRRAASLTFHHTLVLATMGLVRVHQEEHFGEIRISIV